MTVGHVVKASFAVAILGNIIGAYFKIVHVAGGNQFLMIALIASLVFTITAVYEVHKSTLISGSEKTMWTIGFVLTSIIAGLIYMLLARTRITGNQKRHNIPHPPNF